MSGALQVRLGGGNFYDGKFVETPLIGERFVRPSTPEAKQAIRIVAIVSVLGAVVALLLARRDR
jgi:cobalamin biosynthesis protein CobD/CbiB